MNIHYNITGTERKALVGVISEILGRVAVYQGAPTFAYAVGYYTIDKEGVLSCSTDADREAVDRLITALSACGYEGELSEGAGLNDSHQLVVEVPGEDFSDEAIQNLRKIVASKEALIKKAIGTDSLPIEVVGDKLRFPWFTLTGADGESDAYTRFIFALCEMAKKQKRVTAREREVENDKFIMRLFLVRLGLKGSENKVVRRIMLRNLTGNSSWKNGPPEERAAKEDVHYET